MLYRLFLYKLSTAKSSMSAIGIINAAISENSEREWKTNSVAHLIIPFDTAAVLRQIEAEFTDLAAQTSKCRVRTQYPPKQYDQIGFIYVATSYKTAREVLPRLHAIAAASACLIFRGHDGALAQTIAQIRAAMRKNSLEDMITEITPSVFPAFPIEGTTGRCIFSISEPAGRLRGCKPPERKCENGSVEQKQNEAEEAGLRHQYAARAIWSGLDGCVP